MPNVFTRRDWGARAPRGSYSPINAAGRGVIHYSATTITPDGSDGMREIGPRPPRPGRKWYKLWRDPSTPEATRRRVSRMIRQYNRRLRAYNKSLAEASGAFDPKLIALEKSIVRQFQDYHMDGHGWSDIGYHEVIFATGNVYLCRPPDARGAHAINGNDRLGFCLVMTEKEYPSSRMLDSLENRLDYHGVHHIIGHRQIPGNSTACPGDILVRLLHLPTTR